MEPTNGTRYNFGHISYHIVETVDAIRWY